MTFGVDRAAKTSPRIRRNWGRTSKGALTSTLSVAQPVVVNGSGSITLNIAGAGGLNPVGSALSIKLDSSPGLVLSSNGLKILLDATNSCLQLTSGLAVTVNSAGALTKTSTGLQVATDGTTLEISSNAVRIKDSGVSLAKLGALTTKGDVLGFSTTHVRIPVGTDGFVLTADAASAAGVKWASGSGGGGATALTFTGGGSGLISTAGWTVTVDSNGSNLSQAIDGNTVTPAVHTSCANGSWFKFDMGAIYSVTNFTFTTQASTVIPNNYKIEYSTDNSTWTVISASSAAATNFSFTGSATNVRYIRITADSTTPNGSWFCNEFTATGTAAGAALIAGTPTVSSAAGTSVRIAGLFAKSSSADDFGINYGDSSANGYRAVWTSAGVLKLQKVISGTPTDIGTSFTLASDTSQHYFDMLIIIKASNSVSITAAIDGVSGVRVNADASFNLTSGAQTVTAITDSTANMLEWGVLVASTAGGAAPPRVLAAGDIPTALNQLTITTTSTATSPLVLDTPAFQVADIQVWKSFGTAKANLSASGLLTVTGLTVTGSVQGNITFANNTLVQGAMTLSNATTTHGVGDCAESEASSITTWSTTSGTYIDIGCSIALPVAGTYLVTQELRWVMQNADTTGNECQFASKLVNVTDSADVTNSDMALAIVASGAEKRQGTSTRSSIITVSATKTIKVQVAVTFVAGHAPTTAQIASFSGSGRSFIRYLRIA